MQQIYRNLIVVALSISIALSAGAVPAKRVNGRLMLHNGSTIDVTLCGDETMHYYVSNDGNTYLKDRNGFGYPVCSDSIKMEWESRIKVRNAIRLERQKMTRSIANAKGGFVNPVIGQRRVMVILVEFKDVSFRHSNQEMDNYFNQVGYTGGQNSGSVHDYFDSQSYGLLDLQFDVIGPVKLDHKMSYYGANDSYGVDIHAATMIIDACHKAHDLGTDFSRYDSDGDSLVNQVVVVYAGYGENQLASEYTIWPHEWLLSEAQKYGDGTGIITLDGVTIDHYICSNELHGTSGSVVDGIGILCHEFSHCLGLPDFYNSSGRGFGMNCWSIMDSGCYNGETAYSGTTPTAFTSFERMSCGWLTPHLLGESCAVTEMPPIEEQPCAYILYNDAFPDEFYLLENRQQTGWDKFQYGHGMLVLHIDYNDSIWAENSVNNYSGHQRMTIIPADNQFKSGSYATSSDLAGDPWPGTSGNTALTDTSRPAATLFNTTELGTGFMHHPIENIIEGSDGLISFCFDGWTDLPSVHSDTYKFQVTYDIQGRYLQNIPQHGIFITNGHQYIR